MISVAIKALDIGISNSIAGNKIVERSIEDEDEKYLFIDDEMLQNKTLIFHQAICS